MPWNIPGLNNEFDFSNIGSRVAAPTWEPPAMNFDGGGNNFNYSSLFNMPDYGGDEGYRGGSIPDFGGYQPIRARQYDFSANTFKAPKSWENISTRTSDEEELKTPLRGSRDFSRIVGTPTARNNFSSMMTPDPVSSEQTPMRRRTAYDRLQESLGKMPTREGNKPGFWNKLGALVSAGGVGYLTGDVNAGAALGTGLWNAKYNRAMSEWEKTHKGLESGAKAELEREKENREWLKDQIAMGKTQAEIDKLIQERDAYPEQQRQKKAESDANVRQSLASAGYNEKQTDKLMQDIENGPALHWTADQITGDTIGLDNKGNIKARHKVRLPESTLMQMQGLVNMRTGVAVAGVSQAGAAERQEDAQVEAAERRQWELSQGIIGPGARSQGSVSERQFNTDMRDAWLATRDAAKGGNIRATNLFETFTLGPDGNLIANEEAIKRKGLTPDQIAEAASELEKNAKIIRARRGGR